MQKKDDIAANFFDCSSEEDEEEESKEQPKKQEEEKKVEIDTDTDYMAMDYQQLCACNDLGGDSRIYEILRSLFKNPNDEDEELTKLYSRPLLDHLVSRIGHKHPISI